jgi:hypothetical protein
MDQFMLGSLAMGSTVVGLFFLRFWRESGDRLFAIFAVSFFLLGLTRVMLAFRGAPSDSDGAAYLIRLFAFVLIIIAIVDKNRQ